MLFDLTKKSFLITGCDGFLGKSLIFKLCKIIEAEIPENNKELHPTIFAIDNGITSNKTGRIKKDYLHTFINYSNLKIKKNIYLQ